MGFWHVPICLELEVSEKLSLKLVSPVQNTLLLMESDFSRGEESVTTLLRVMPMLCRRLGLFPGLEVCLD